MFDFGKANPEQREAIQTVEGPLLIIAGPGTGKTFTLVQRAIYLIREKGVKPEQIMMATFTEKAAKELITRISNELARLESSVNINDMYIGTFHSICFRLIKEYPNKVGVKKNYRALDSFEQRYVVFRDLLAPESRLTPIKGLDKVIDKENKWGRNTDKWDHAGQICRIVNELREELVTPEDLAGDSREYVSVAGQIMDCYEGLISSRNYLDFSGSQAMAYRLLENHPDVLAGLREKIKYLMVDEYQDTNRIQEKLLFLLAGERQNICVVGDDDQSLYRFRGATVRNILTFPDKFEGRCHVVKLVTNYRSDPDIVRFYNDWMQTGRKGFEWGGHRYDKEIRAGKAKDVSSPAVVRLAAQNSEEDWKRKNLDFVNALLASGKITDPNQIAFLFDSVRSKRIKDLAAYFEENGVRVYSPRSDLFFERREVKLLLGFLLRCFPNFAKRLKKRDATFVEGPKKRDVLFLNKALTRYYNDCLGAAQSYLSTPDAARLRDFLDSTANAHASLRENADYNFTGLVYRMFAFEPFRSMLDQNPDADVIAQRPARNLSLLISCLGTYEYQNRIDCLKPATIDDDVRYLFTSFMDCLKRDGIHEYEDESQYAPSGCVSFLTIHQSKGMEFPVVVVGSLDKEPGEKADDKFDVIRETYYKREQPEQSGPTEKFDFLRKYYTAFSRAQNLLALTANERTFKIHGKTYSRIEHEPSAWFKDRFDDLPDWSKSFDLSKFTFDAVKDVNLKEAYSFTAHVSVYETCPRKYKFFRELGFTSARVTATFFGTLVHQTIEDMHKAALRGEADQITEDNIRAWAEANHTTLSQSEHVFLSQAQREAVVRQAVRYAKRRKGRWDRIREAEVDISVVKPDYILKGTIDLIQGEGDTVEIVDFKSEKKPAPNEGGGWAERYKKQLQIYAHLVQERTGRPVSRMHLYYTGDESDAPTVTFENDPVDVEATLEEFDGVVHKIMKKDFAKGAAQAESCESCDFQYYCHGHPEPAEPRPAPAAKKAEPPRCPICGKAMVRRRNRSTGEQFWGCRNYWDEAHKRR